MVLYKLDLLLLLTHNMQIYITTQYNMLLGSDAQKLRFAYVWRRTGHALQTVV